MDNFINISNILLPEVKKEISSDEFILEFNDVKLYHVMEKSTFTIYTTDYLSFHILRLVVNNLKLQQKTFINSEIKLNNEYLNDYFIILKEILETNYYNYCTICGIVHDKLGMSYITTCNNQECIKKIYHYPTSNKITDFYKSDSNTLILLFKTMFSAFNHPKIEKIFEPIPLIHSIENIKTLKSLVPDNWLKNNLDELNKIISETYDDFYLWKKLDNNIAYALLLNAVSNNYYSMYSYKDLVNNDLKKKILFNENPEDDLKIEYFNINYSTDIENKIKSKLDNKLKYYYLYHGSPFHCWNSIIKNGLKVMSGTEFMTTGAVYGNGIYLSNNLATSVGYAKQSISFNYSMVGLFQIIEDPEKYKKTTGIYVIPDEKILILRTLIKINKITNHNIYKQLDDYFIRQRTIDKSISDKNLTTLKNKRLSAEFKLIEKVSDKFKVTSYSDEQENPWIIELIVKDKIYKIKMQFHNYPLIPPFFEMIDFNEIKKGIIDKDLKINLPILNPTSWNISNKIVEVLDIIWNFFNNTY